MKWKQSKVSPMSLPLVIIVYTLLFVKKLAFPGNSGYIFSISDDTILCLVRSGENIVAVLGQI